MALGTSVIESMSRKPRLNTLSSTHAELVCADNAFTMVLWTSNLMEAQGYPIKDNILLQDKKSAIFGLSQMELYVCWKRVVVMTENDLLG